jgi:type I restriction enzyme S subunit
MSEANGLPASWIVAKLADLIVPKRERVLPSSYGHLPFVGMENVESQTMRLLGTVPGSTMKSSSARFIAGDVLYGRLRPYLNKIVRPDFGGMCSAEFMVFPDTPHLRSRFLQYRLHAADFVSFASHLNDGDRPRVDFEQIGNFELHVPPATEQERIVAKIEELFSDLDAGVAALQRVRANLKRYRASVLKAAVEGKLTAAWRAEQRDLEPASELLRRILSERRRRWEADQRAKHAAAGKPAPKDWQSKYTEPALPDTTNLPKLPDGWCWVTIEAFAFVTKLAGFEFTKYVKYDPEGDLPVIKAENAGKYGFNPTDYSKVKYESVKELTRSLLHGGEVLMVFVGAGVGKVAIVPRDQPFFLGPNIAMIRTESDLVNPEYLELFLRSPLGYSLSMSFAKAVAQPSLSMGTIRQIPVAVPGLKEQEEIVSEVKKTISIIDHSQAEVEAALMRAARLRQSILKRAFAGELVPQDPSDEPATVLLDRIRRTQEEKTNTVSKGKPGKRKTL